MVSSALLPGVGVCEVGVHRGRYAETPTPPCVSVLLYRKAIVPKRPLSCEETVSSTRGIVFLL